MRSCPPRTAMGLGILAALLIAPAALAQCNDADSDGYFRESGCGTPTDCNDAAGTTNPGATEVCDGYDNDCDGRLDEGCTAAACDSSADSGDVRIDFSGANSYSPRLVWTGSGYGAAWYDGEQCDEGAYFVRLDAGGAPVGSDVLVGVGFRPSIVWTGSEFGFAWQAYDPYDPEHETGPILTRLDSSGNRIGSDVIVSNAGVAPSLAWTGSEYGIAFMSERDGNPEIYFARLDAQGNKIGNDVRITDDPGDSYWPALAWSGSGYGVAWRDVRDGERRIWFARLDAQGNRIGDEMPVTTVPPPSLGEPALVWAGGQWGIAWTDSRDGNHKAYFTLLAPSGARLGADVRVSDNPAPSSL